MVLGCGVDGHADSRNTYGDKPLACKQVAIKKERVSSPASPNFYIIELWL